MNDHAVTHWEKVGEEKNWGRYLRKIEKREILRAARIFESPGTALEVGCDGGHWSKLLSDAGWKLVCTDVNKKSLKICKSRIPEADCILVDANDKNLPCATQSVDLLLCIEVPEVLESEWFISESRRVLREGGIFVSVFWNRRSFRGLFHYLMEKLKRKRFVWYGLSYSPWKKIMERKGYRFLNEIGYCWFPFRRDSNSPFVPMFESIERLLGLQRMVNFNPWVMFIAQKNIK